MSEIDLKLVMLVIVHCSDVVVEYREEAAVIFSGNILILLLMSAAASGWYVDSASNAVALVTVVVSAGVLVVALLIGVDSNCCVVFIIDVSLVSVVTSICTVVFNSVLGNSAFVDVGNSVLNLTVVVVGSSGDGKAT